MPEAQLRRAIAGPAEASGLRVESALIDAVLADTRTASRAQGTGVLPRLSQALMLTWDSRENDELTAAGYARSGRVACAVEVSAEAVYGGLPEQQQEIARETQQPVGVVMTAASTITGTQVSTGDVPAAVAFSGDGTTLATAGGDGTARLWDVAFPAGLLGAACTIADQSLTRQQWADYAGSQPFQQVCPAS